MAYTDPQPLSQTRIVSIVVVILIHALLLYWMFTGGYKTIIKKVTDLTVIDVKDPPPPPEKLPPPPPPDKKLPPPPETPVVKQIIKTPTPPVVQYNPAPPPSPVYSPTPVPVYAPAPVVPPPAPPPPAAKPVRLSPRGSPQSWVTTDDYPPAAQREGAQGTLSYTLQVGADGRATSCVVGSSSGNTSLDDTACKLLVRRARFNPGTDSAGNKVGGVYPGRFTWKLPSE